ncbi:MAG: metallophosphoesterase [Pseudomonadota bacterium]
MTAFRFIHASDLHLGKAFARFPEAVRGRLREARHGAIGRLAEAARQAGAAHILLAGDTFDSETPSDPVWRQALAAFGAAEGIDWWLIPGNHDSLAAEGLWDQVRRHAPPNLHLIATAEPVMLTPGIALLPAPLPRRYPGRDLTDWMPAAPTPEGTLRLGLAHGSVLDFQGDGEDAAVIPPDRAATAGLAYLALGDWHGTRAIGPRCGYSGTPEHDGFRHQGRGGCLSVCLEGEAVTVERLETGVFDWHDIALELTPESAAEAALSAALPGMGAGRRDMLLRLQATGRVRAATRALLAAAISEAEPLFHHLQWDESALATEYSPQDLDDIAVSGALRLAAEDLYQAAESGEPEERIVAAAALDRLYSLVRGADP